MIPATLPATLPANFSTHLPGHELRWRRGLWTLVVSLLASLLPGAAITNGAEPESQWEALAELALIDSKLEPRAMLRNDFRRRVERRNRASSRQWAEISGRAEWETFADGVRQRLERSLGDFPPAPKTLEVHSTATIKGEGFQIENLLIRSRGDLWITANLYRPMPPGRAMPGILICHSHHTPKHHGELQDMGMSWARAGSLVLVMDQLGHGERREHPFVDASSYPDEFRVSRQDYYFRYDTGIQLHLAGQSLIGQIVWDLRRGVDLLLDQPGIDPERIALLGAVAGGGDPAAVTAAIEPRIRMAVPFNFGGPQPETRYPLPEDIADSFNYAGGGSWESTRNLRGSASAGFLPWAIVSSFAPRHLVYAHEFNWHQARDPVWKRLEQVYRWYEMPERLDYTHGFGELKLRPPNASHCTHIGPPHRVRIHQALYRWFDLGKDAAPPIEEYSDRRPSSELNCWTAAWRERLKPQPLHEQLTGQVQQALQASRRQRAELPAAERRAALQQTLSSLLGDVEPTATKKIAQHPLVGWEHGRAEVLEFGEGIYCPLVLLLPEQRDAPVPAVLAVAQQGKQAFLRQRSDSIESLLKRGIAVCLADVRGTGETRAGNDRGRNSSATSLSSAELLLGGTTLGGQLRDLRSLLGYLRAQPELDAKRLAVWGDSFRSPHPDSTRFDVPRGIGRPAECEPAGGMLALLAGLYEPSLVAVHAGGSLDRVERTLHSSFVYLPHDAVVPHLLRHGDLPDIVAAMAPLPVQLSHLVDHRNVLLPAEESKQSYLAAREAYQRLGAGGAIRFPAPQADPANWLASQLLE